MERNVIITELTGIFKDVFNYETDYLKNEIGRDDVENWNSLSYMHLLESIETKFGIKFKLSEIISIECVYDIVTIIEKNIELQNNI